MTDSFSEALVFLVLQAGHWNAGTMARPGGHVLAAWLMLGIEHLAENAETTARKGVRDEPQVCE